MYQGKYSSSVILLQILAISGIFIPLLGISASFLAGIGKVKEFFLSTFINTLVAIVVFIASSHLWGITGIVIASVFLSAFLAVSYTFTLVHFGKITIRWTGIFFRYRDAIDYIRRVSDTSKAKKIIK